MHPEPERGDDPEVAAATTAARPEQIRMVICVNGEDASSRIDQAQRQNVVAGQPERAGCEPHTSPEGQSRDADGRARAGRDRDAALPEPLVQVDQACTGPDRSLGSRPVHAHVVQP